ncbi:MAG: hypothetical protein ACRELZ_25905 [Candidatus Rokuibacteriota bacterium]
MNPTKTMMCGRCHALRWVEDWKENRGEMMSITLGPCGHLIELSARLEWTIPSWPGSQLRLVHARPARAVIAAS